MTISGFVTALVLFAVVVHASAASTPAQLAARQKEIDKAVADVIEDAQNINQMNETLTGDEHITRFSAYQTSQANFISEMAVEMRSLKTAFDKCNFTVIRYAAGWKKCTNAQLVAGHVAQDYLDSLGMQSIWTYERWTMLMSIFAVVYSACGKVPHPLLCSLLRSVSMVPAAVLYCLYMQYSVHGLDMSLPLLCSQLLNSSLILGLLLAGVVLLPMAKMAAFVSKEPNRVTLLLGGKDGLTFSQQLYIHYQCFVHFMFNDFHAESDVYTILRRAAYKLSHAEIVNGESYEHLMLNLNSAVGLRRQDPAICDMHIS